MGATNISEELRAGKAFDKQSTVFDELYRANPIIQYKRNRVRALTLKYLQPGNKILELNAGTGGDAGPCDRHISRYAGSTAAKGRKVFFKGFDHDRNMFLHIPGCA